MLCNIAGSGVSLKCRQGGIPSLGLPSLAWVSTPQWVPPLPEAGAVCTLGALRTETRLRSPLRSQPPEA